MSSGWQEAAAQQAEEVSSRLRQLLIKGLGLLRSELGLELGLQPQRYPSWVFLAVPVSLGLLFLFLLLHCATSRGSPRSKRAAHHEKEQPATQIRAPAPSKALKVEEPKKKSKKKAAEKAKPNGRPVELAEEVVIPTVKKESSKQPLDAEKKNEKIKKNKKKPKADSKSTQSSSNQDKKEAEEGNWETKISNKEKRQQRKRDKGADTDVGASDTAVEAFTTISTQSTNIRKSKGQSEASAVNGSSWNEKPTKVIPSQLVEEKWVPPTNTAGKKKAEPSTWNQDTVDSNGKEWSAPWSERSIFPGIATWSTVDSRLNSSEKRPQFSTIGINKAVSAAVNDSVPQTSSTDNQWEGTPAEPSIDDEWSGLNGLNSGDPSSDWSAPAEEWGNYGEEDTAPNPQTEEPEQEVPKVSDDDKDKDEQAGQTAASKTKKKKKKKKKPEESATQEAENAKDTGDDHKQNSVPAPVIPTVVTKSKEQKEKKTVQETRLHTEAPVSAKHNNPEKKPPQAKQPQETNASISKQNSVAPPSQAKSEESWESPKQVKKKKKARRET
ncbi:protein LYRIC [Hyla sarda]|uniref:protein LYRIC n=1 Tax=Hyla sarda TaxID=327740 RepID=UPI0024C231E9|nr:protein LYRIC [Hyla sarda]